MSSIEHYPIILASQSPRRAALLREAGFAFDVASPLYEEPAAEGWRFGPVAYAEAASHFKARGVADLHPDRVVLAADTVVALDGDMFGKPADVDDARRILTSLMGTTHEVITGVTLLHVTGNRRLISHVSTAVTMRALTAEELDGYLAGGQWEGKAGAYGIQDRDDPFVQHTDGSFSNVVGLPMERVLEMLAAFDIQAGSSAARSPDEVQVDPVSEG